MHLASSRIICRAIVLALVCTFFIAIATSPALVSARQVTPSAPTVATHATLTISNGLFSRTTVVVLKGGTLTLTNTDNLAYRIKVGATPVVIAANGSKTVPLPQIGTFSITCAKASSLRATLTVK